MPESTIVLMQNIPIADVDPATLGVLIPILGIVAGIVAILAKHQQRMTMIIHAPGNRQSTDEVAQLRKEVFELKQMVHEQMIALDSYAGRPSTSTDLPLQQRMEDR